MEDRSGMFAILDYADYNTRVIADLIGHPSVAYHKRYASSDGVLSWFVSKIVSLPERCFGPWYAGIELSSLFRSKANLSRFRPVLIVYECNLLARNMGLLNGLRQRCGHLKLVLVLTNIIGTAGDTASRLEQLRKVFDLVVTFSEDDADRYELTYYEGMYSRIDSSVIGGAHEGGSDYDVYFCGKDKGRLWTLERVAEEFRRLSISYRFDIIGNPGPAIRGFHYHDKLISNTEMLRRSSLARLCSKSCQIPTTRVRRCVPYEAYALGVKLLSNNRFLAEKPWFNPKQISIFSEGKPIDADFVRTPLKQEEARTFQSFLLFTF